MQLNLIFLRKKAVIVFFLILCIVRSIIIHIKKLNSKTLN
jgi:hypothetical protein